MDISVIIPSYKPGQYIYDCLSSLSNQSFEKERYEILIILNGCKEPWFTEISKFMDSNMMGTNVRLVNISQSGVSNARNVGLALAKGDYITFIDDDDFVSPFYLKELSSSSTESIVGLSYTLGFVDGTDSFFPNHISRIYDKCIKKNACSVFEARSFFSGPVYKLLHKNIIKDVRFDIRLKNGEDTLFMFLISPNIKGVNFCNKKAVYYRRYRKDSASMGKRKFLDHLKPNILQLMIYTYYFLKSPFRYNFLFYLTRCGGSVYDILSTLFSSLVSVFRKYIFKVRHLSKFWLNLNMFCLMLVLR